MLVGGKVESLENKTSLILQVLVAHTLNPNTWEVETEGREKVVGLAGKLYLMIGILFRKVYKIILKEGHINLKVEVKNFKGYKVNIGS